MYPIKMALGDLNIWKTELPVNRKATKQGLKEVDKFNFLKY
jgi:hypothetical protein